MKVIFLDIDGVLNAPARTGSCRLFFECVEQLNAVVKATGAKIVLSSTWRIAVHGGSMTLGGFEYMLHTHGGIGLRIVGLTISDDLCSNCGQTIRAHECSACNLTITRGRQITAWLKSRSDVESYVAIDDEDDITSQGHPLVRTNGKLGLTAEDASRAIGILNAPTASTLPKEEDGK